MRPIPTYLRSFKTTVVFATVASCAAWAHAANIQLLHSFGGPGDAFTPHGGLVEGADGAYYGTSQGGGSGFGTVFRFTPAGALTILSNLNDTTGYSPTHELYRHSDGNFYGSARDGGTGNHGTAFRITPDGVVSIVASHSFQEGADPSELTAGPDGNLYGLARLNGLNGQGTLFRVNLSSGTITTLANLAGTNGWNPYSGLTLGADNKLYGVTADAYPAGSSVSGSGNVLRYTVGGALENVVTFPASGLLGKDLAAPLTLWTNGTFYGSAASGGANGNGTIFRVTTNGSITKLVDFRGTNGSAGASRLMIGRDGNFYGTTSGGGAFGRGTVFRMTPQGLLTSLASFNGTNGTQPAGPLAEGKDGNLYGTTSQGGAKDGGAIFRVIFGPQAVTRPATSLLQTSATLGANINSFGETATFFFEYGTDTSLGSATAPVSAGTTTNLTLFTAPLTGLQENRTYYFRAVSSSASGTRRGEVLSFTTITLPTVTIIRPTNGDLLEACAPNSITATASNSSGRVVLVRFYSGANVIGTVTNSPFTLMWSNVPAGPHVLSAVAVDEKGLTGTSRIVSVIAADTTPPQIVCVSNLVVECTSGAGAAASFSVAATDSCDLNPVVTCIPASGSVFPMGTNAVRCTAKDSEQNVSSCEFTVAVVDTTAPILTCPVDMATEFTSDDGANVSYAVSAMDFCDPAPAVRCAPMPGSLFPFGTTQVLCTAEDHAGNRSTCGFLVQVSGARSMLSNVLAGVLAAVPASRTSESNHVNEVVRRLEAALQNDLWVDENHLQRQHGEMVFQGTRFAMSRLCEMSESEGNTELSDDLRSLANKISKADRLLAALALREAVAAGVSSKKTDLAQKFLAAGDVLAEKDQCGNSVAEYRNSWQHAARPQITMPKRLANGHVQLEIIGEPRESFRVQVSTNLVDWTTVGSVNASSQGVAIFEDPAIGRGATFFYKVFAP